jgi:hypothetical protein
MTAGSNKPNRRASCAARSAAGSTCRARVAVSEGLLLQPVQAQQNQRQAIAMQLRKYERLQCAHQQMQLQAELHETRYRQQAHPPLVRQQVMPQQAQTRPGNHSYRMASRSRKRTNRLCSKCPYSL